MKGFGNISFIMNNIKLAAKRFKRGISAKPLYDLNKNTLELIHDLTTSKLPQLSASEKKKNMENEINFLISNVLLGFTYIKGILLLFYSNI